ncbi:MAG: BON domain-containing protein [Pseudomonadota bacterium]
MKDNSINRFHFVIAALLFCIPFLALSADDEIEKPVTDEAVIVKGKEKSLTLPMGASRILQFPFVIGPVNLGDETVLKYERYKERGIADTNKLMLTPKVPGTTDLTIHDITGVPRISYTVRVTREDLGQVMAQLEELLGDIEGLKIRAVGGTVVLDGEIVLPKDMVRINRVVEALKERDTKKGSVPVKNLASISKLTMTILAERIEREIGSPEITVKVINNNLFLEGTATDDTEADRAKEIARTYMPEVVVYKAKGDADVKEKAEGGESGNPTIYDFLKTRRRASPPPAPDIKITVNFVELSNEYDKAFNFNWRPLSEDQSAVKFDSAAGEITSTLIATVSGLLPKLSSQKTHQHARVLKQQQLIVKDKSEQPASIDSSVDIYSSVLNANGVASLTQVPVQNTVRIKAATIDGSDSIDLGVQLSLGSVIGNNQGQPIVARNSLATTINVKNGDSAAIGGFAIDEALAGYNRAPSAAGVASGAAGFGGQGGQNANQNQSPLFNLNRSKAFDRRKQQYIIFVTPEVLKTASAGNEDMTRKFRLNSGEK